MIHGIVAQGVQADAPPADTDPFFADVLLLVDLSKRSDPAETDPFWDDVLLLIDGSK